MVFCICLSASNCCSHCSRASPSFSRPLSSSLSMVAEHAAKTQAADSLVNSAETASLSMAPLLAASSLKALWILCLDLLTAPSRPATSWSITSNHSSACVLPLASSPASRSSALARAVSAFLLAVRNRAFVTGSRWSTRSDQSSGRSRVTPAEMAFSFGPSATSTTSVVVSSSSSSCNDNSWFVEALFFETTSTTRSGATTASSTGAMASASTGFSAPSLPSQTTSTLVLTTSFARG
mmetsp:Transcript_6522/g.19669  ORF Transcript_6522/g.19669 Transcript_6522/m.19669 type:complete len:237 (+) Transcript_6522:100-810(+)